MELFFKSKTLIDSDEHLAATVNPCYIVDQISEREEDVLSRRYCAPALPFNPCCVDTN